MWLAQVGRERMEETLDSELTIDRALDTYLKKGYSREWINQRLQAIRGGNIAGNARKELEQEIGAPVITSQNAVQSAYDKHD